MSRYESDREDLLREATALVRRAEWTTVCGSEAVVAGFRRDGGLSLYFGGDPVYHFDSSGRLKRGFRSGRLYRTQGTTLAELRRERTETEIHLMRRDLEKEELDDFLAEMAGRIEGLRKEIHDRRIGISRIVPLNDTAYENDFAMALREILVLQTDLTSAATESLAPRYRGKR